MSNPTAIPLTDAEVSHLMLAIADKWEVTRCNDDACDHCMTTRDLWWDLWSRLTDEARENLALVSMLLDISYPKSPPFNIVL